MADILDQKINNYRQQRNIVDQAMRQSVQNARNSIYGAEPQYPNELIKETNELMRQLENAQPTEVIGGAG